MNITLKRSAVIGGVTIGGTDETVTSANAQQVYQESIADSTTNHEVDFPIDVSTDQVEALSSTRAVTIKTNDPTTPAQTLTLGAGVTLIWSKADPAAMQIFTTDVTKLYITNSSGGAATVTVGVAADVTP